MSGLDLSLDDVIAANRKPAAPRGQGARQGSRSAGGRGGGRSALGAGFKQAAVKRGGAVRPSLRGNPHGRGGPADPAPRRRQPRTTVVAMERDDVWSHDLFNEPQARPAAAAERAPLDIRTGTKLLISNLHPGVTTTDVQARGRGWHCEMHTPPPLPPPHRSRAPRRSCL